MTILDSNALMMLCLCMTAFAGGGCVGNVCCGASLIPLMSDPFSKIRWSSGGKTFHVLDPYRFEEHVGLKVSC